MPGKDSSEPRYVKKTGHAKRQVENKMATSHIPALFGHCLLDEFRYPLLAFYAKKQRFSPGAPFDENILAEYQNQYQLVQAMKGNSIRTKK